MIPVEGDGRRDRYDSKTRKLNVDSSNVGTQQIYSQYSPGGVLEGCGAEDFLHLIDTMPVDDAYLFEDEFETQVVDLAEETQMVDLVEATQVVDLAEATQVVDLAGETQVVDLAGETQALDDADCLKSDFFNEFNAEVCADIECEKTNNINVICETQVLSPDNSVKNADGDPVGIRSTVDKKPHGRGSICGGFTALRVASIRASGLAAKTRRTSDNLSTSIDKSSLQKETFAEHSLESGRKNNLECLENDYNNNSEKSSKSKIGCRAVRQLFRDGEGAEVSDSDIYINQTHDNLDEPAQLASEDCLGGLSYANSQEPGELSQAHALDVVDTYLGLNLMDFNEYIGTRVCNLEKTKVVSGALGSRDLAKSSSLKSKIEDFEIYDWDDTREDDGGGEFFLKNKELFFPKEGLKQRCNAEQRKFQNPRRRNVKTIGDGVDENDRKNPKNKVVDPAYSDSRVKLHMLRSKGKSLHFGEESLQKNMKNSNEWLDMVSGPEFAEDHSDKDVPDMQNVGPDTQMAAEAMETLCFEVQLAENNNSGLNCGVLSKSEGSKGNKLRNRNAHSEEKLALRVPYPDSVGVLNRQAKRTKRVSTRNQPCLPPKSCKRIRNKHYRVLGKTEEKRLAEVNVSMNHGPESTGQRSVEKNEMVDHLCFNVPVAHRTRNSIVVNHSKVSASSFDARDDISNVTSASRHGKRTSARERTSTVEIARKVESTVFKQPGNAHVGISGASDIVAVDNLRQKRFQRGERLKRSSDYNASICLNKDRDLSDYSATCNNQALPSLEPKSKKVISYQTVKTGSSSKGATQYDSDHLNAKVIQDDAGGTCASEQGHEKNDEKTSLEGAKRTGRLKASQRRSTSTCATPTHCITPKKDASPICMGDEYFKQSCRSNLVKHSLLKEIDSLIPGSPVPSGGMRESRKRKDITTIKVLFSQHLDVDVVKHKKKILARLGGAVAFSMLDATHFVADEFVRTRNMLEAIALGKPVVTHSWIESCGQASCLIDEKMYILRDAKKEKEFGFSLPVSLARACQHPLLKGQKVLVTPNTKPGKDILASLVKAVQGLVVERLGRSVLKDKKLPDDLLILSCEEDHETCVPLLEKGGAIYSSELLLNGIVKQKLEYERHRLFLDQVKRTRSTIWVKSKNKFHPVTK